MSLDIRHQDPHIVVVDKPFGLPSQGTQRPHQDHLFAQVKAQFPHAALHHRLDTPASGLVLFTFTRPQTRASRRHVRSITRGYLAVVVGDPDRAALGPMTWTERPP